MAYESKLIGKVEGFGEIYRLAAPLPEQIEDFQRAGCQAPYLPDVEETAQIRLAGVSQDYTRTSIVPVAVRGAKTILTKVPLLMNPIMARLAVIAHRKGAYLEIPGIYDVVKQIAEQESEKEPEDKTALELLHEGNHYIARDSDVARFLLRKQRKPYFKEFVPSGTISLENLQTDSKQGVVNYLWVGSPRGRSYLYCGSRYLEDDGDAFGVRRVLSGEASAKNSSGNSLTDRV